ncbi:MAG: S1 family peptidase [Candidatus Korarchaeum sp.]|nr:S1 family peptidase [Candidatus Korarchaeum sp.]MDW8035511.1 hypothetical protein [Candidatus Korarchaeum sp.]
MITEEEKEILEIPGVTGTFVKDGVRYILLKEMVPLSQIEAFERRGWKVLVSGEFTPLIKTGEVGPLERRGKYRPIVGGISIGHPKITAGTLGILMKDKDGNIVILSNNHVLACSSSDRKKRAEKGDVIIQPGKYDGGNVTKDGVGVLTDWIPIAEWSYNEVDAAIAKVIDGVQWKNEILDLGKPKGIRYDVKEYETLVKSGRTSEITRGPVYAKGATVSVNYGDFVAYFTNQILVINPFGQPGDSGSAVFDKDMNLIGLLFAGSMSHTVVCPIKKIIETWGLKLIDEEAPPPTPPGGKGYKGKGKGKGKAKGYATVGDYKIPIDLDIEFEEVEEGVIEE